MPIEKDPSFILSASVLLTSRVGMGTNGFTKKIHYELGPACVHLPPTTLYGRPQNCLRLGLGSSGGSEREH